MNVTSMKSLSTQEMLDISKRCLVTRRAEFDGVSETHGALSLLDRAHQKLERASAQSPATCAGSSRASRGRLGARPSRSLTAFSIPEINSTCLQS